ADARPSSPPGASAAPAARGSTGASPAHAMSRPFSPAEEAAFISMLRARYGMKLASPLAQMKLIETLVREFRARGGDWHAALLATLQRAFPETYGALAARLEQWLAYESWMQQ